jgi:hypothetical protein
MGTSRTPNTDFSIGGNHEAADPGIYRFGLENEFDGLGFEAE